MRIDASVKAINLVLDTVQDPLVLTMLFGVTTVKAGKEPHDRPANQSDHNWHPHRFHGYSSSSDFLLPNALPAARPVNAPVIPAANGDRISNIFTSASAIFSG